MIIERLQKLADEAMAAKTARSSPSAGTRSRRTSCSRRSTITGRSIWRRSTRCAQVIHLRSYAQKKPIDEYKQEAFLLFERLLIAIREDVTRVLMRAQVQLEEPPPPPVLPDFITQHLDPFSGDDDTADIDFATGAILSNLPPLNIPQPPMPAARRTASSIEAPVSRNAPCPCGSGRKYKHCHGQLA